MKLDEIVVRVRAVKPATGTAAVVMVGGRIIGEKVRRENILADDPGLERKVQRALQRGGRCLGWFAVESCSGKVSMNVWVAPDLSGDREVEKSLGAHAWSSLPQIQRELASRIASS